MVAGGMKIGNMSFSVVDMTVSVGGFPITITRTYDSRDTIRRDTGGDFGVGWSLSIAGAKVQKSGSLATGWTYRGNGLGLSVAPFRSHLITVTTADGRTYSFAPTLVPDTILLTEIKTGHVEYQPRGTTPRGTALTDDAAGALSPDVILGNGSSNTTFDLYENNGNTDVFDTFYNPTAFRMTLRNGTSLLLAASDNKTLPAGSGKGSGLLSVIDRNGNHLDFGAGGITSYGATGAAQAAIKITRGGGGGDYITAIQDPNGKKIVYNQSGDDLTSVTNRVGDATRYTYDGRHFVTGIIDPRGIQPIRNIYDAAGRLIQTIDARGNTTSFSHDLTAGLETTTDRMNYVTRSAYDSYGNITHVEKPVTVYVNGVAQATGAKISSDMTYSSDPANYSLPVSMTAHVAADGSDDRTSRMAYDGDGNLTDSFDALNHHTAYTYDRYGKPLTATDPLGRVTVTKSYDIKGNPQSSSDALGNTTTTAYDPNRGWLLSTSDALGNTTTMRYDFDTGRVTGMTSAFGHGTAFAYDANGNKTGTQTTRTKADGTTETQTTLMVYDDENRVIATVAPNGLTTRTVYNEIGEVAASYDSFGRVTTYQYDELGRQVQMTQPDGIFSVTAYDDNGRIAYSGSQCVRENGTLGMLYSRSLYDEAGRPYGSETWDGIPGANGSICLAHSFSNMDLAGEFTGGLDARNNPTGSAVYDKLGRTIQSANALKEVSSTVYDAAGQETSMTDALGHSSSMTYDLDGRVALATSPVATRSIGYDALGRRTSETDGSGRTNQYEYDALGRLSAVVDGGGYRTVYGYDELGQKTSQTDANGHTTRFVYDNMGRMIARQLPLHLKDGVTPYQETMTYRLDGRLSTKTDFNGIVTTFSYDDDNGSTVPSGKRIGHLMRRSSSGGTAPVTDAKGDTTSRTVPATQTDYTYYDDGTRAGATRLVNGASTHLQYFCDLRGRLVKVVGDVGTLAYTYDDNGNKTSISKLSNANTTPWTLRYVYDALNRLQTVTHPDGLTTSYKYDAVGNRIAFIRPNGVTTRYGYDAANRLTAISNSVGSSFIYTLDGEGRRRTITDSIRGATYYQYDGLGRLTNESGFAGNITYQYDAVGNRIRLVDSAKEAINYAYDSNDRLLTEVGTSSQSAYSYDANGNMTGRATTTAGGNVSLKFDYDAEDKLFDTVSNGTVKTMYLLDPKGDRVQKSVYGTSNATTSTYLVDTTTPYAQVVEETDSVDNGITTVTRYDFADEIVRMDRTSTGGSIPTTLYYTYDDLGSTVGLTDANGNIPGAGYAFCYDAFGNIITGDSTFQPFLGVGGQQYDSELGLYFLRSRYYAPVLGRLLSQDPLDGDGSAPMSLHRYLYGNDDPTTYIDPSGEFNLISTLASLGINTVLTAQVWSAATSVMTAASIFSSASSMYYDYISYGTVDGWDVANLTFDLATTGLGSRLIKGGMSAVFRNPDFRFAFDFVVSEKSWWRTGWRNASKVASPNFKAKIKGLVEALDHRIVFDADEEVTRAAQLMGYSWSRAQKVMGVFGAHEIPPTIYVRSAATYYQIFHEFHHSLHAWAVGVKNYQILKDWQKELHVYNMMKKYGHVLSAEDLAHAEEYIRSVLEAAGKTLEEVQESGI